MALNEYTGTIPGGGGVASVPVIIPSRRVLIYQNQSSDNLFFTGNGTTPSATNGFLVQPGGTWMFQIYNELSLGVPDGQIQVYGASGGEQFWVGQA